MQVNENKVMPPIIFLGNKKDLTDVNPDARMVSSQDVNDLIGACQQAVDRTAQGARRQPQQQQQQTGATPNWSILHYETSALTGEKIDSIFDNMVREIRSRRRPSGEKRKKDSWCFLL